MKKIYIISMVAAMLLTGCNEDKFLEEKALDFNSASNSYNTAADYDAAITELYYLTREEFYTTYDRTTDLSKFADMWITADPLQSNVTADLSPSGAIAKFYWDENYKLIAQANTVISRLGNATGLTDEQKKEYEAKARFFRALGYRTLSYLYGDVPLQLEEVTEPKTDYARESKDKVLAQVLEDLNLPPSTCQRLIRYAMVKSVSLQPTCYWLRLLWPQVLMIELSVLLLLLSVIPT